jgi:hypothetical protein
MIRKENTAMQHLLPAPTIEEMKDHLRRYYQGLRLELSLELDSPEPDSDSIALLRFQISEMERLGGPWLMEPAA